MHSYEKGCRDATAQTTYILDNYGSVPLDGLGAWMEKELDEVDGHVGDAEDDADQLIAERDSRIEELEAQVADLEKQVADLESDAE